MCGIVNIFKNFKDQEGLKIRRRHC